MPVSRKRKTKKSTPRRPPARGPRPGTDGPPSAELVERLSRIAEDKPFVDARKASVAAERAGALISELVGRAPTHAGDALEDELCARLGPVLSKLGDLPPGESVEPAVFATALLNAVVEAAPDPDDGGAGHRVRTAVARILPRRSGDSRDQLDLPVHDEPTLTGQALWARDAYGSRFAITAPFSSLDGTDRWYLWDVDACGIQALTVHCAYYPSSGSALDAWLAGVGDTATADSALTPVDDPVLVTALLTREDGITRLGGEHEEQFAEFLRSRRLAEVLIGSLGPIPARSRPALDAKRAAKQFSTWLRARRTPPKGLGELATELAESWSLDAPVELYGTCSPHRVAMVVPAIRDYYTDDTADQMLALLPDWVSWLADRNGTPAELVDRCRPYALGEPYPGPVADDGAPDLFARVPE